LFAHDVLKTLYSPIKAFEEIVKKPDVKGPLLILVLILLLTAGLQYASASKISDEEPMTNRDEWTESAAWIPEWASNGEEPSRNADNVVGNYSVMSSVANNECIWMRLTGIGPINCSGDGTYERLSFRIKWIRENGIFPNSEVALRLLSNNNDAPLKLDFSDKISNSSGKWSNVTVDIGPKSKGWESSGSLMWENVTGVEFVLAWEDAANLTMKIDDLYFAKFVPLTKYFFNGWFSSLMMSALGFFIHWGLYGGVLLLVIKGFGEKLGSWKALFLVVGYLFSVRIIHLLVSVVLVPMLPEVRLENLAPIWYSTLPYQTILCFSLVTDVWIAALCAIAVRFFYTFTWKKALGIAVLAGLLNFTLRPFIPI
jgi:hypothetical protein